MVVVSLAVVLLVGSSLASTTHRGEQVRHQVKGVGHYLCCQKFVEQCQKVTVFSSLLYEIRHKGLATLKEKPSGFCSQQFVE